MLADSEDFKKLGEQINVASKNFTEVIKKWYNL